jgi:hypothetical protein
MSKNIDDGRHEGWVAHVFAGTYGGSWASGPIATQGAGGAALAYGDWITHSSKDIVGWQAICSDLHGHRCWHGPLWTRMVTTQAHNPERARIYSEDNDLPWPIENLIMVDREAHIGPFEQFLRRRYRSGRRRLGAVCGPLVWGADEAAAVQFANPGVSTSRSRGSGATWTRASRRPRLPPLGQRRRRIGRVASTLQRGRTSSEVLLAP